MSSVENQHFWRCEVFRQHSRALPHLRRQLFAYFRRSGRRLLTRSPRRPLAQLFWLARLDPLRAATAASACMRAITARHFKGSILRRARNCRLSDTLKVATYARRARDSYRQAISARAANPIGTAKGIIADRYHMSGNGEGRPVMAWASHWRLFPTGPVVDEPGLILR